MIIEFKAGDEVTISKPSTLESPGVWSSPGMDYLLKGSHVVNTIKYYDRTNKNYAVFYDSEANREWWVPFESCKLKEKVMYEFGQRIYVSDVEGTALEKKWEFIFIKYGKDNSVIVVDEGFENEFNSGEAFETNYFLYHATIPEPTYKPIPHEEWLEFFGKPIREVGDTQVTTIDILNPDGIGLSTGSTRDFEDMMEWEIYLGRQWNRLRAED